MFKPSFLIFMAACVSCNTGNLNFIADLPKVLNEVSGTETVKHSDLIWMLNDGGNSSKLFGVRAMGKIKKEVIINAKNNDWEDLTTDNLGNIYIGDFGNNLNNRKNLAILKIKNEDLKSDALVNIERISFYYPNQASFPPKKKQMYFDCEAFFHFNDSLYLYSRSRVKNNFGKTSLYKIPAKQGNYEAIFVSEYIFCKDLSCSITAADISKDGKKVILLNHDTILLFTNYFADDFLNGKLTTFPLKHESQKEGVCFKNENTLYITDEKGQGKGGNLYEFKIN